jgi:hypothetical protein
LRNDLGDGIRRRDAIRNKSLIGHHTTTPVWAAPFLRDRARYTRPSTSKA